MMNSPRQIAFGQNKRNALPQQCKECDFLFACHGECPKTGSQKRPPENRD